MLDIKPLPLLSNMADPKLIPNPTVLFAGLGAMGYGMASRLLRSGYSVIGYDVHEPSMHRFATQGGASAPTPRAAAADVDVMIVMVANQTQATPLLFDPASGAVQGLKRHATVLVCSTVSPGYICDVERRVREMGREDVGVVDAPVSGGATRAADGTLSVFSSGSEEALSAPQVQSILACLSDGRKLYRIPGGVGGGSKAKLVHQIFAGIHIAVASEAMGLAAAAGLDTKEVFDEVCRGPGASWMFGHRVPFMLQSGLGRYSATSIIAKDVGIVLATATEERFPLPLVGVSAQLYASAVARGWAGEDDCVLVRLYLPEYPDLVIERAGNADSSAARYGVCAGDIQDLLVGVHLAGMSEAMRFCDVLGLDADLMFDIVCHAAGGSRVFEQHFRGMRGDGWGLKGVEGAEDVRTRLVCCCFLFLFLLRLVLSERERERDALTHVTMSVDGGG